MNGTPIFRVEERDGKPTLMEARLLKKSGSWWHIAGDGGKTIKLNGGGDWSETVVDAWEKAISRAYAWANLIKSGVFEGDWYAEIHKARNITIAALEDMHAWGELQGEINAAVKKNPQPKDTDHD